MKQKFKKSVLIDSQCSDVCQHLVRQDFTTYEREL